MQHCNYHIPLFHAHPYTQGTLKLRERGPDPAHKRIYVGDISLSLIKKACMYVYCGMHVFLCAFHNMYAI